MRGRAQATGWVVLVAWFVGCLVGLLVWPHCCSVGWHSVDGWTLDPFFFTQLPLLGALVGWLACCNCNEKQKLTASGESTGLCGFGCLGLLVAGWATNAKQTSTAFGENTVWSLPFLFNPTSFGRGRWCVGWKPSLSRTGFLDPRHLGKTPSMWFGCLVCWLACWFGRVVAWSVGRLVGTPLMDGCMDGRMDGWMDGWMHPALPHVPEASGSVSGGSRRSGQSLRSFRRVPKGQ